MKHYELTVFCSHEYSDIISAVLLELSGEGTAVYDIEDIKLTLSEKKSWDYLDEGLVEKLNGNDAVSVKGFFATKTDLEKAILELNSLKAFNNDLVFNTFTAEIDDSNYVNEWKKYYEPFLIRDIAIVPSWLENPFLDKKAIFIDPGAAFGTGTHASTKMCIDLMQNCSLDNQTVLDIGSGSGILSLCALRLNARYAFLVDNDPMAIENSRRNAEQNGFKNVDFFAKSIFDIPSFKADIVFANLTADILIELKSTIKSFTKVDTYLILSGIIDQRLNSVLEKYQEYKLIDKLSLDGWNALLFKENA